MASFLGSMILLRWRRRSKCDSPEHLPTFFFEPWPNLVGDPNDLSGPTYERKNWFRLKWKSCDDGRSTSIDPHVESPRNDDKILL